MIFRNFLEKIFWGDTLLVPGVRTPLYPVVGGTPSRGNLFLFMPGVYTPWIGKR